MLKNQDLKNKLGVGDRVRHKFRGWGTVHQCEEFNPDPTSICVELDEGIDEVVEISLHLIEEHNRV